MDVPLPKFFMISKYYEKFVAKSFYYVNYGLSIITSKISQIISVMKT